MSTPTSNKQPTAGLWTPSSASSSAVVSASKRRRYRAIYEDDELSEEPQPSQVPVRPSDQYPLLSFLQFCDMPESDESLLPEMRDFARRLNIPQWAKLTKQQLCQQIRQRMSLTDLPVEMLREIGGWLPADARSILKSASRTVYQSLPATNLAQEFVDLYGGRAFEVLFGLNVLNIDRTQYESAKTLYEQNPAYFNDHDLNVIAPYSAKATEVPHQFWDVEFVPGIVRRLKPLTQQTLIEEYNRQIDENRTMPISIPLVRIQTTQDYGRDTTACAIITLDFQGNHVATIHTPPSTVPPSSSSTSSAQQLYAQMRNQSFDKKADQNFAQSAQFFSATDGWYLVVHRERNTFPWLSFHGECGMQRRSQIAQAYMNAVAWSIRFQQEQPELHPILAVLPRPAIGITFWETKAREEQAIADLFGYRVETSEGPDILPKRPWVTKMTNTKEYKQIAQKLLGPLRASEYNPLVLRMMTPTDLHTKIFLPMQARVQAWWEEYVYPEVPRAPTPQIPGAGGVVQPVPPIIPFVGAPPAAPIPAAFYAGPF